MSVGTLEFQIIHYEPIYSNLKTAYNQFQKLYNDFKKVGEENVNFKVLSYYYAGMLYIIKGDELFKKRKYDEASKNFEEALKLLIRSRASRGREGDKIFNEMVKWISYGEGMQRICFSFIEKEVDKRINLISESQTFFTEFLEKRKLEEMPIDLIAAKAHNNYANYLYEKIVSEKHADNTKLSKKHLLKARSQLMSANYLYKSLDEELEDLQNKIDEITKQHIVERAEWYWDRGTELISVSNFNEALKFFAIASRYYARASVICANFMEQRLYLSLSRITEASQYESEANEMYKRKDQPKEAAERFHKAVETVDVALGLLASIKSDSLIKNMSAQRAFYEALAFETEGIHAFDNEQFDEALESFEVAMKKLEETQLSASEGSLDHLLEFVRTAKSEVEGYISMARAMKS